MRIPSKSLLILALSMGHAYGQTLRTRGAMVAPELTAVYEAAGYEALYEGAGKVYDSARAEESFVGVAWDSHKQMLWLMHSQQQIVAYLHAFEALKHELDAAAEDRDIRSSAERVAAISLVEDRLTADNIGTLNALVTSLDLGTLFVGNHKAGIARLWVVRKVPESLHRLDGSKMGEVVGFPDDVNTCLSESSRDHVVYSKSASFTWNVPTDENDKPLNRQQADVFWQAYTHRPVDKGIAELYGALGRAEAVVKAGSGAARVP